MKKKVVIIVAILLLVGLIAGGVFLYIRTTPEYALLCIGKDIKAQGIKGLQPHVTGDAKTVVDALCATGDGGWLSKLWGYASKTEFVTAVVNECDEIQWDLKDIHKSKSSATVVISFNYKYLLKGTIDLSLVKESGDWKIDGLGFPKFD